MSLKTLHLIFNLILKVDFRFVRTELSFFPFILTLHLCCKWTLSLRHLFDVQIVFSVS